MNQNPNALALAIVHAAVQASELQEAQEAIKTQAEHLKEAQKAIDTLVADREATKKAHAEHLEQIGKQLAAEQEALRAAHVEHNEMMRKIAAFEGYGSADQMLAAMTAAPPPVETDGGEAA